MVARRHERESTRDYNRLKGPKPIGTVGIEKVFEMDLALNGEMPAVTSVSLMLPFSSDSRCLGALRLKYPRPVFVELNRRVPRSQGVILCPLICCVNPLGIVAREQHNI